MNTRKYDSTVARIAGNILSGYRGGPPKDDDALVGWAVQMAWAIVAEVKRTDPESYTMTGTNVTYAVGSIQSNDQPPSVDAVREDSRRDH